MPLQRFKLVAEINATDPVKSGAVLFRLIGVNGMMRTENGFKVTTTMLGRSAAELNRELLSALRQVDKETTVKSEWRHGSLSERFCEYALKRSGEAQRDEQAAV